jgi:beta-glucosidase
VTKSSLLTAFRNEAKEKLGVRIHTAGNFGRFHGGVCRQLRTIGSRRRKICARIPTDFLWGAATAGHQVEGNNTNSDVWAVEHAKPSIFVESSGDACDSFNRWPEDMDIVRTLGLNSYRFSLEWARIEPSEGEFSIAMLDHYRRMIEGCRARGLVPVVTFNHFTTPRWFACAWGLGIDRRGGLFRALLRTCG